MPGITAKYSAEDYLRVRKAFGARLNLGRTATDAETEDAVQDFVSTVTADYERDVAAKVARDAIVKPVKSSV